MEQFVINKVTSFNSLLKAKQILVKVMVKTKWHGGYLMLKCLGCTK